MVSLHWCVNHRCRDSKSLSLWSSPFFEIRANIYLRGYSGQGKDSDYNVARTHEWNCRPSALRPYGKVQEAQKGLDTVGTQVV